MAGTRTLGPDEAVSKVPEHVSKRRGVLGLSSVMAATGDGVESSPILRCAWVPQNLFGTSSPPPSAGAEPLEWILLTSLEVAGGLDHYTEFGRGRALGLTRAVSVGIFR